MIAIHKIKFFDRDIKRKYPFHFCLCCWLGTGELGLENYPKKKELIYVRLR